MALLNRARGLALAGVTSAALVVPLAPFAPVATAAAAPAPQAVVAAQGKAAVPAAGQRKRKWSRGAGSFSVRASRVMGTGNALRGTPYRRGGASRGGFDCSGFTQYVYRANGVSLPRVASAQRSRARYVSRAAARAGDLVFFHGRGGVYHVGIYAGGNRVLHSPRSGRRVSTERIWTRNVSFGRVL
jgi:cell wall-associated NlpC family hydrolase